MVKCKICGEREAVKKGMCIKCYNKYYYNKNKERLKLKSRENYKNKKLHTCPMCGGYKEADEKVCKHCREKWNELIEEIWK